MGCDTPSSVVPLSAPTPIAHADEHKQGSGPRSGATGPAHAGPPGPGRGSRPGPGAGRSQAPTATPTPRRARRTRPRPPGPRPSAPGRSRPTAPARPDRRPAARHRWAGAAGLPEPMRRTSGTCFGGERSAGSPPKLTAPWPPHGIHPPPPRLGLRAPICQQRGGGVPSAASSEPDATASANRPGAIWSCHVIAGRLLPGGGCLPTGAGRR